MKTSKIVIKNLFGIRETTLDGKSVEISGPKGAGKTSVLDAIRFALTNRSERDCIVHQGADEGEIIIETTTGLSIDRKALPAKSAGTVKVRDGSLLQTRPAEFLSQIFTPLQLNPVEFTQLSRQEKNRVILSLIEFDWDVNWIREQFGEIPQGVDYSKHILEVLNDIQAENGVYFQSRQNINRDIRNKQAFISDIAKDIPSGYDYDRWNQYPIGERYRELERLREKNSVIERAKAFRANFTSKLRGLEGSRDVEIGAIDRDIAAERAALTGSIERMKAELQAILDNIEGMDDVLFVIYCGLSEKDDELPPAVRDILPRKSLGAHPGQSNKERGQSVVPEFQIRGNPGTRRGSVELDQHGYLYQELYERYRNVSEQRADKWSHPIARLLVKVFQTLSWPFKYWGRGVK